MTVVPTFSTSSNFLGVSRNDRNADFVIAGIPLDIGTTGRSGSREAPAAVRAASRMLIDGCHPNGVDVNTLNVSDIGNIPIMLGDIERSYEMIENTINNITGQLICLGGEHGVTLPILRALIKKINQPLGLVHFDAHLDTSPDNFGQKYAHGSVFYHAINEGLIDAKRMIQIGIRAPIQQDIKQWTIDQGSTIVTAEVAHTLGPQAISDLVLDTVQTQPTYLSFDVDALDPAFAPGTGTPEIGGLASWQVQSILRKLIGVNFVGLDVVEVAPAYDVSETTSLLAATVVWEYLALMATYTRT